MVSEVFAVLLLEIIFHLASTIVPVPLHSDEEVSTLYVQSASEVSSHERIDADFVALWKYRRI